MIARCKTASTELVSWLCEGLAAVVLAGCTVGPEHVPPATAVSAAWHSELKDGLSAESVDPNTLASWWTTFDDPQLSHMVERAVAGNLDLKTATSRIRESRARRGVAQGAFFPTLNTTGSAISISFRRGITAAHQ